MTEVTGPESPAGRMSLPARLIGIIVSPKETYADVAARPRVLGVLLVTLALSAGVTFWFQSTEIGQKAVLDQLDQSLAMVERATGQPIPDEQYQQMATDGVRQAPYTSSGSILVGTPLLIAVLSAILLGVFNGLMGGKGRYKQVFAIVTHAGVIWTLAALFSVVVATLGGDLTGASKLSVFAPMLESGFLYHLLRGVDLFWLWGFVSIAIGLGVLYRRRTGPIAATFIGVYLVCVILYAGIRSALGG